MRSLSLALSAAVVLIVACGGSASAPVGGVCIAGTTQACVCPGSPVEEGVQICVNASFLPCACSGHTPDGGTGRDGGIHRDGGGGRDGESSDGRAGRDGADHDASEKDAPITVTEAGFNDGRPNVDAMTCVADAGGPGPVQHLCVIYPPGGDDENECDGHHDLAGFPPNGPGGNGFDDNCNGLVDEGCACTGVGTTKACYLVPASQTQDGLPVGWCAQNSKGTVNCVQQLTGGPTWGGTCRGAQEPYADDVCAPGDFNCDGKAENSVSENCSCQTASVTCPSVPLTTAPYPSPTALPLQVDAAAWFSNPLAVAQATGWQWTLTGGDCDNILPHPSFGIYATPDGSGDPLGTQSNTLGVSSNEHGMVASAPQVTSSVYPAFSLSGDYLLGASWTLDGRAYACSIKVQVRAPGLRAEGCWDTEGVGDDLDLHVAKVNGFTATCPNEEDWSNQSADPTCAAANEDCYYEECYSPNSPTVDWGYASSPSTACSGWGSQGGGVGVLCSNPRLDRDANGLSGTCDATVQNPNDIGSLGVGAYCGPENINIDNPTTGDTFAVALRFYNQLGTTGPHGHVNVYCDGERVLSSGYDPTVGNEFPELVTPGQDTMGDMWKVALVTTTISSNGLSCAVTPTTSTTPDPTRDGSTAYCVDDYTNNGANSQILLTSTGAPPATAAQLCFH